MSALPLSFVLTKCECTYLHRGGPSVVTLSRESFLGQYLSTLGPSKFFHVFSKIRNVLLG